MILKQIAQKVAEDTAQIIGFPVSISDDEGYLIGVTDKKRLGLFDNLLANVIKSQQLTYWSESDAKVYPNIYPGVAAPIIVNNKVLGAVGIIGKTEEDTETKNYINLVTNHIEMVCHEAIQTEIKSVENNAVDTLIHYAINFDEKRDHEENIVRYGKMLGFDLNLPRVCILIELIKHSDERSVESLQTHEHIFEEIKHHYEEVNEDLSGYLNFNQACILKSQTRLTQTRDYIKELKKKTEALNKKLSVKYNHTIRLALGDFQSGISGIKSSYENALQTLDIAHLNQDKTVYSYEELAIKLDIALHSLPESVSKSLNTYFKNFLTNDNYSIMANTFTVYCDCKFNLSDAARTLYIHRNSLIYRLKKIEELTTIDIDKFDQCLLLYMLIKSARTKQL